MMMISDPTLTGKWVVIDLFLEHNHDLAPHMVRFMRCHREIPAHVKNQLKVNDYAGIKANKSINAMFTQAGGAENCTFIERDCRNFIANERKLALEEGDAAALLRCFEQMQDENPDFFYSIELTTDSKLRNVFWADARSRAACQYFGDVVAFDTTYLTNRYAMPFAPFVGVNHHGKSTLLGCALLCDETTETFQWLFNRWLKCMDNKHPTGIITDQCPAMTAAISHIFPNTRHRFCIWHIMRKVPEKLGGRLDKGEIIEKMNKAIYDVLTIPEFESMWSEMVDQHALHDNDWIQNLYQIKHFWVPVFLNDYFWAGMSSTQRSESMNSFFDGYVTSKTTLKAFFEQYTNALRSKYEKEAEADFKSFNQEPKYLTFFEFEKQLAKCYTLDIFFQFQREIKKLMSSMCSGYEQRGEAKLYFVTDYYGENTKTFQVMHDPQNVGTICICKLLQFKGIICSHILCVWKQEMITKVPECYIWPRWRKDYKRMHSSISLLPPTKNQGLKSYDRLSARCQPLIGQMFDIGHKDTKTSDFTYSLFKEAHEKLMSFTLGQTPSSQASNINENITIYDPIQAHPKGRPPSKRLTSHADKSSRKKKGT